MNKNDLIKTDKTIFRVLDIKDKVLVIDCIKRTMPVWLDDISGVSISEQELQIETGVILTDIDVLSPNTRKTAYKRYTAIASVVAVIDDKSKRNSMIRYASEVYKLSKQTIRAYLCIFLSYQNISALAPHPKKERELTADEKIMRWALNRFFYTRNKNSLKTAFELMLKAKYCDDYGKICPGHPTFNQFRYFYRKTRNRYTELGIELDIYIPSIKVAVEYDGRVWHDNSKSVIRDNNKNDICADNGIKLFRIREDGLPLLKDEALCIPVKSNDDDSLNRAINQFFTNIGVQADCDVSRDYSAIMKSFRKQRKEISLGYRRPDLAAEFDSERNGLTPFDVALNNNHSFWWKCPKGHDCYKASPNNRNRGAGCPLCGKQKAKKTLHEKTIQRNGLLKDIRPDLFSEIDREKLSPLIDAELLHSKDDTTIPWKCPKCSFEWETKVYYRVVKNGGCPSCSHSMAIRDRNFSKMIEEHSSLAEKYPDIAKEWNYVKNAPLTPNDVPYGTPKKVWWICSKCSHEYQARVNSRTNPKLMSGCSKCKANKTSERCRKAVINIETGQVFESVKAATDYYGKKSSNISAVCRGERELAFGCHWKYIDDPEK